MSRQWQSGALETRDSRQSLRSNGGDGYEPDPFGTTRTSGRTARPQSRGGTTTTSRTEGAPSGRQSARPGSREGPLLSSAQSVLKREPSRGYGTSTPRAGSRPGSKDASTAYSDYGRAQQAFDSQRLANDYSDGYGQSTAYGGIPVSRPSTQTRQQRIQPAAQPRTVSTAVTGTRPGSSVRGSPFAARTSQNSARASTARQTSVGRSSLDYGYAGYDPGNGSRYNTADYDYPDYPDEGPDYGHYGGPGQADFEYGMTAPAGYRMTAPAGYFGGGPDDFGPSSGALTPSRTALGGTRASRDMHPFAASQQPLPPATAPARSDPQAGVMLSDYMARMEIIPRGDARGGGSRGGSRAASRATSAGSDNFIASNLSDADCTPYDDDAQQVSDSSSDDERLAAPPPAPSPAARPPTSSLDRVTNAPERPRPLNGFDLRPATSAVLGSALTGNPLSSDTTREVDLSALHEDLFSPKDAPAPSGRQKNGGFKVEADWELGTNDDVDFGDLPVKQRRATSASVVQARSPWGDIPADRPPSRQKPPPESLDLFAGGTADPRGLVLELRGGRQRPMTAMAATANGVHGSKGMGHGGLQNAAAYRPPTNVSQRPPQAAAAAARLALPRSVLHRLADDIYHGSDGEHEEE